MTFRWRVSAPAQTLVIGVAALTAATTSLHAQEPAPRPDIPQQPIKSAAERPRSPPKPQTPPTSPNPPPSLLHSYVSGHGADHFYCTLAAPCRTFQYAHDHTSAGGEVTALDSADYGPLAITKAISIVAPSGVEASIDASPGQLDIAIIAGPADTVALRGLTLEGAGQSSSGIQWLSGLRLEVIDCVVRNFSNYGLYFEPGSLSSFLVANTVVSDNGQSGIYVGQSGVYVSGNIIGSIVNTTVVNNNIGVNVHNAMNAAIQLSGDHIDNNVSVSVKGGLDSTSPSAAISLILRDVTLNQTPIGVDLSSNASVWMSHVTQAAVPGFGNFASVVFEANPVRQQSHAFSDGTNLLSTSLSIRMSGGALVNGGAFEVWPKQ